MTEKTTTEEKTVEETRSPEAGANDGRPGTEAVETSGEPTGGKKNGVPPEPTDAGEPPKPPRKPKSLLKKAKAAGPIAEIQAVEGSGGFARAILRMTPSWLISMLLHIVMLLALALITLPPETADELRQLVIAPSETEELDELELDEPLEEIDVSNTQLASVAPPMTEDVEVAMADDLAAATVSVDLNNIGLETAPKSDLLKSISSLAGDALSGRGEGKALLVARDGGSEASERAVAAALKWIAEHQYPDGGWNFNVGAHSGCRGHCRNPGLMPQSRNAATALALLPFLGAGQTHKMGKYKKTVKEGIYFLINRMRVTPQGGSLLEPGGRMYSHGLAAIVLCEAAAMTNDKGLAAPAQQAINFICFAQDPIGGGWRYEPRQKGDTSVLGWQLMALKSGYMGYLQIPKPVVQKAWIYLDTVQANNGATYGYTTPGDGPATSAIGLLSRMYLGWKKDNPALERGVQMLAAEGPSKTDMYYNYYATQVLRHWEGDLWKKWNEVMRDQLVRSQATQGHEKGSWYVGGGNHPNEVGGRLYCTSMATMVLEVYYRHLPIYRKQSTEADFPLD